MITGTVYGVALNDQSERDALGSAMTAPPYKAPPNAPVLYVKPRICQTPHGGQVVIEEDVRSLTAAPTLAISFNGAPNEPTAMALAIDLFETHDSVFRPAIRQRCRDGFLPIGAFAAWDESVIQETFSFQVGTDDPQAFNFRELVRTPQELISELSEFMTLSEDDVLLIGLPLKVEISRDAPSLRVAAPGLSDLSVALAWEHAI